MFHCHVCGSSQAQEKLVSEVSQIDGKPVLVEKIPATLCANCREATFSRKTTERVRRMVHGEAKPVEAVQMDVYAFS